jgi:hypothetical protein
MLVHELMDAGWYRVGRDPDRFEPFWGFRRGHTLPASPRANQPPLAQRWIAAPNETVAMRRLMHELKAMAEEGARRQHDRRLRSVSGE